MSDSDDNVAVKVIQVHDLLDGDRVNFLTLYDEVVRYIRPQKTESRQKSLTVGSRRGATRYDATGEDSSEKLTAQTSATVMPRAMKWFELAMVDDSLNELAAVKEWLDDSRDRMLSAYGDSNFYEANDTAFSDLIDFGTDCVYTEEQEVNAEGGFSGFNVETWFPSEFVFWEGKNGLAEGVIRKFPLTLAAAREKFEAMPRFKGWAPNGKIAAAIEQAKEKPDVMQKQFTFMHAIQKRAHTFGTPFATDMPYSSHYVSVDDKSLLHEGGYLEFPAAITRWKRNTNDKMWGRGPSMKALPDVMTKNEARRLGLGAMAKDLDPPVVARHKGVVGAIRTGQRGITYVRQQGDLSYLESGRRTGDVSFDDDKLARQIRSYYFIDQLEMLIGEPTPNMTAFEFGKRVEIMRRLLGSTFGRLEKEKLNRQIVRGFNVMNRRGGFAEPPQELLDAADSSMEIRYIGPLARAQRLDDVDAIERTYALGNGIAQATGDQSHFDAFDATKAMLHVGELHGMPAKLRNSEDDIKALREQRAADQQQQQGLDAAEQMANVAAKAPEAVA